ncbi:MAG: hypothetical protein ACRBF0_14650 [Calditrichia bacterium]
MKPSNTFIFLLISFVLYGQSSDRTTLVHGKVVSATESTVPLPSKGNLHYEIFYSDGHSRSSSVKIGKNGEFEKLFYQNTKIALSISYPDFYTSDTTILYIELKDCINVNFIVQPKEYFYTEQSAERDLSNGNVQIILFDDLIYNWNRKLDFTKQFGFKYLKMPEPVDHEFRTNMANYNNKVEAYLDSINDPAWNHRLNAMIDSLTHLAADNYGKANSINLNELAFPYNVKLSDKMKETIRKQQHEFKRIFQKKRIEYIEFSPEFILNKIDNDPQYHYIFIAEYWMAFNYEMMIPELLKRITDKREVGLIGTTELIISERIKSGDMRFSRIGRLVFDDLFTISGRANHLLQRITGEEFGLVSMYSNEQDLKKLQNRWAYWLLNLKEE